jgi:O-antigen ligase
VVLLVGLSIAGFYLLPHRQANNFPTYLLALAVLLRGDWLYKTSRHSRTLPFVALVLGYFTASVGWSDQGSVSHLGGQVADVVLLFLFLVAVCWVGKNGRSVMLIAVAITAVAAVVAGNAVHDYVLLWNVDELFLRLEGITGTSARLKNAVVAGLAFGWALLIGAIIMFHKGVPAVGGVALALPMLVLATGMILTQSRAVVAGVLVSVALMAVLTFGATRRIGLVLAAGTGALVLAAAVVALLMARYYPTELVFFFDRGASYRLDAWREVLRMNSERWFGLGILEPSNVTVVAKDGTDMMLDHPHSIFVSAYFYGGLVGLTLVAGLVAQVCWVIITSARSFSRSAIASLGLFGFVVLLVDGNRLTDKIGILWFIFWIPIALAGQLPRREQGTGVGSLYDGATRSPPP